MAASAGDSGAGAAAGEGGARRHVVKWEQLLPRRPLRVLLVEHDDSTRQVVAALLRKCGYQVAAVADGLKAWELMQRHSYDFDLVLTEVTMPSLSGIDLLARIVAADKCTNIPVVMMSSQDSIGVVLKCMHKGAVDFLVKPVRKNELRNLWQHVWRRHCAINQANGSENNAGSNHVSTNGANQSKSGETCDAESLNANQEVEVQSAEKANVDTSVVEIPSRLCKEAPVSLGDRTRGTIIMDVDSGTDKVGESVKEVHRLNLSPSERNIAYSGFEGTSHNAGSNPQSRAHNNIATEESLCHLGGVATGRLETDDPIVSYSSVGKCSSKDNFLHKSLASYAIKGKDVSTSLPVPDSTWKNQQSKICTDHEHKEKEVFSHSNASAFLRYGDTRSQCAVQKAYYLYPGSSTQEPVDNARISSAQFAGISPSNQEDKDKNSTSLHVPLESCKDNSRTLCSSSVIEHPSTNQPHSSFARQDSIFNQSQYAYIPVPIHLGSIPYQNFCSGYGAMMQPILYAQNCHLPLDSTPQDNASNADAFDPSNCHCPKENDRNFGECYLQEETQQLHHSKQFHSDGREQVETLCISIEPENQSASCNNDLQKARGCGETVDPTAHTLVALESGNESGVQNCCSKGLGNDLSRREAALVKFRMKRKDRCFEKKVRYHSRKKLADQRPRVKGQFVSQKSPKSTVESDGKG